MKYRCNICGAVVDEDQVQANCGQPWMYFHWKKENDTVKDEDGLEQKIFTYCSGTLEPCNGMERARDVLKDNE